MVCRVVHPAIRVVPILAAGTDGDRVGGGGNGRCNVGSDGCYCEQVSPSGVVDASVMTLVGH